MADDRCYPDIATVVEQAIRAYCRKSPGFPDLSLTAMAQDIVDALGVAQGAVSRGVIEFEYCNWEGRKSLREARPISIRFGKSEWHPKPQWLMLAFDIDRGAEREFAMADMAFEGDALAALVLSSTQSEGK